MRETLNAAGECGTTTLATHGWARGAYEVVLADGEGDEIPHLVRPPRPEGHARAEHHYLRVRD